MDRKPISSSSSVRGILANVNYIGKIRFIAHEKFNGVSSDHSKQVVQGSHEPIISMELWNEVQELMKHRYTITNKSHYSKLFIDRAVKMPFMRKWHGSFPRYRNVLLGRGS
ncbi:recombinase family protein [Paenibacillus sp. J23TS9]|uniref:recombinase family protein n=1 Tax=Paenibacillus sp. J23TS9 TaxID=2807193 RepID=UPI001BCA918C